MPRTPRQWLTTCSECWAPAPEPRRPRTGARLQVARGRPESLGTTLPALRASRAYGPPVPQALANGGSDERQGSAVVQGSRGNKAPAAATGPISRRGVWVRSAAGTAAAAAVRACVGPVMRFVQSPGESDSAPDSHCSSSPLQVLTRPPGRGARREWSRSRARCGPGGEAGRPSRRRASGRGRHRQRSGPDRRRTAP